MRIRDLDISPKLILAPMEGVTDLTFRRLVRAIGGCGLTVTEFIPASQLHLNHARARAMAAFDPDEHPISIQVYGKDPETLARAAKIVEDLGADIVDLNMGCPSKKVCKNSGGSALMKDPRLARDIVRAMRAAVSIPFTVKMRAGFTRETINAPEIAYMCQEEGAEMVAVHWRTREEKYGGVRDLSVIRKVKERLQIPVVANGDVIDVNSALDTLAQTGCDGLMIGRGAVRNPWVFREIEAALLGQAPPTVDADEKERVLLDYFSAIRARFHTDKGALGRFKKIARYFTDGVPYGDPFRQEIFHSRTPEEAIERVRLYFERLRVYESGRGNPFADESHVAA